MHAPPTSSAHPLENHFNVKRFKSLHFRDRQFVTSDHNQETLSYSEKFHYKCAIAHLPSLTSSKCTRECTKLVVQGIPFYSFPHFQEFSCSLKLGRYLVENIVKRICEVTSRYQSHSPWMALSFSHATYANQKTK